MKRFQTLLLREWLQHRFAWSLMLLIPLAIAASVAGVGQVEFDAEDARPDQLPLLMSLVSIGGTAFGLALIASIASVVTVIGLARRDHGDRSHEFWLSLPVGHAQAFAAPLLVHLLIVPAAALAIGWLCGLLISLVLTSRVSGFGAWLGLPWGTIVSGTLAVGARAIAGLPLALLWLSPLILILALLVAWFRRWGLVIFAVALLAGALASTEFFGSPWPAETVMALLHRAGQALFTPETGAPSFVVRGLDDAPTALGLAPQWAVENFWLALTQLASPLFAGALIVAAACFVALMDWRRRGVAAPA